MLMLTCNMILQSTLFKYIEIIGVKPNTALLIVISYAMLRGDSEGAAAGFFAGLMIDFFFGRIIGMNALIYMTAGYLCGKPFKDFFRENLFFPLLLGGLCVFCASLCFYFAGVALRGGTGFIYFFRRVILPETAYTIALTAPVYRLVYAVNERLERREKRSRLLFKEDGAGAPK